MRDNRPDLTPELPLGMPHSAWKADWGACMQRPSPKKAAMSEFCGKLASFLASLSEPGRFIVASSLEVLVNSTHNPRVEPTLAVAVPLP